MDNSFGSQRSLLFRVFHNEFFRLFLWAALLSAVLYSLEIYSDWYSLSIGTPSAVILTMKGYAGVLLFGCALSLPLVLIAVIINALQKTNNRPALLVFSFLVAYVAVGVGCFWTAHSIRISAFHQIVQRGMPIVDAIKKYIIEQGHPPATLEDLVPRYLPEIPTTGVPTGSEYMYEVAKKEKSFYGNPWMLRMVPPQGGFSFEELLYLPLEDYGTSACGWGKIANWAHCREL